jgi:uncharacterized membrane protein YgcG
MNNQYNHQYNHQYNPQYNPQYYNEYGTYYGQNYRASLLNDLDAYFPDILYRPHLFTDVSGLLQYITNCARYYENHNFLTRQQLYMNYVNTRPNARLQSWSDFMPPILPSPSTTGLSVPAPAPAPAPARGSALAQAPAPASAPARVSAPAQAPDRLSRILSRTPVASDRATGQVRTIVSDPQNTSSAIQFSFLIPGDDEMLPRPDNLSRDSLSVFENIFSSVFTGLVQNMNGGGGGGGYGGGDRGGYGGGGGGYGGDRGGYR